MAATQKPGKSLKSAETEAERRARHALRDVTDKLGLKPGQRVRTLGKKDPALIELVKQKLGRRLSHASQELDVILYWPRATHDLTSTLGGLRQALQPAGAIWVILPKKGKKSRSGAPYIPDQQLIKLGLAAGLVDNKVCSISDVESAMRFVIRLKDRAQGAIV